MKIRTPLLTLALALTLTSTLFPGSGHAQNFAPEAVHVQPGHSGSWSDTQHRGQGFDLQIIGTDRAVASWQTATPDGQSLWLYGDGRVDSNAIEFTMYQASGSRFPGSPGAGETRISAWGTLTFSIAGCGNASISWRPTAAGYSAGSTTLARLTQISGVACSDRPQFFAQADVGVPAVAAPGRTSEGKRAVVVGGEILVATGDGLWRRRLDTQRVWERAGLAGVDVAFIRADSSPRGRLFAGGEPKQAGTASLYVSHDSGRNWEAAQSSPLDPDGKQEGFVDLAVSPRDSNYLFGSLSGGMGIAFSVDGGQRWERVNGDRESRFGYSCHIAFLPEDADRLYQGCESPLDFANLWVYELNQRALGAIGEPRTVVGVDRISNRRPQVLLPSPARPGWMYAGLEGALVAFTAKGALEYVYRADESGRDPYIYVSAVWIDPSNPRHLVFGGGLNGPDGELTVFETFDHGLTHQRLQSPSGLRNPTAQTILALDDKGDQLAIVVEEENEDFSQRTTRVLKLTRVAVPTSRIRVGTGSVN